MQLSGLTITQQPQWLYINRFSRRFANLGKELVAGN